MDVLNIVVICLAVSALTVSTISVVLNIVFFRMQIGLARTTMRDSTNLAEETKTVLNEIRISQDITGKQVKDQYDKLLDAAIQPVETKTSVASSAKVIQEVNERLESLEKAANKGSSTEKLKNEIEELRGSFKSLSQSLRTIVLSTTEPPRARAGASRFERFSEGARRALTLSQEKARELKSSSIDVEHLLLGLLEDEKFRAYKIINSLGVDIRKVRDSLEYMLPQGTNVDMNIGLTSEAKNTIDLAINESRKLEVGYTGTEHLLLGLLAEQGTVAALLNEYGVTTKKVRGKISVM